MKLIILLALFIPISVSAAWWNPLSWFEQASVVPICEPQIIEKTVEKIVEVPVEVPIEVPTQKVVEVEKIVEKPVIQYVTKEVIKEVPTDNSLELSQWETAFNELKPRIENLTPLTGYYSLRKQYEDLVDEYRAFHTEMKLKGHTTTGFSTPNLDDVVDCFITINDYTALGIPKAEIVCE